MPVESYRVFTRTWWKPNPSWPNGREPGPGPKRTMRGGTRLTYAEAREMCREYNESHNPGPMSHRAEFERE